MSTPDTSREALEHESEVTFFIASGPGGQHHNRNATGVRLVHRLSGIVVTVPAARHYRRPERKLMRLQRRLSRCQQGSKKREKVRRLVARQHQRVANQRKDHLHKLSASLVRGYSAVVLEDLNVKGLSRSKMGKSVHDAGWAMLRFQLGYKARWQRKHLVTIGRLFPSSRLGPSCGPINRELTLAEREWTCGCGVVHD